MAKKVLDTVHETAKSLHKAGVMETRTMREFDALCLPPVKDLTAAQIKRLRTRNKASQAVFAARKKAWMLLAERRRTRHRMIVGGH